MCPTLIQPIVDGVADVVYGSRLSGGKPQRALSLLASGRKPLPEPRHGRALQHDADRHGDRVQGVSRRRAQRRSSCVRTGSRSSPRSPGASVGSTCASTRSPSPTTDGRMWRARRSPGVTVSRRSGFSSECASRDATARPGRGPRPARAPRGGAAPRASGWPLSTAIRPRRASGSPTAAASSRPKTSLRSSA